MSFSKEWEEIYRTGGHNSIWPWSDLISLTHRYLKGDKAGKKVLELGCGAGANIPFFLSLGMDYYAIEGSEYQTECLKSRFGQENVNIKAGDFTKEIPFECKFDLIVDRGSITCNFTDDIRKTLSMVYDKLIEGGIFLGVDWFSDVHSAFVQKDEETELVDDKTCIFHTGYFNGLGAMHFFNEKEIRHLLKEFSIAELSEKIVTQYITGKSVWASWNLAALKTSVLTC